MTLTNEQVQQLTAYFEPEEHEFLRGFTYITEGAITTRLDSVDPNWTFEVLNVTQRGEQVIAQGRLQVGGIWRDNVGMAKIIVSHSGEQGEPEKSAVTDALKRCARLFGIGRYLLGLPGNVKDMQSLTAWLRSQNGVNPAPQAQQTAPATPKGKTPAAVPQNAQNDDLGVIPYIAPGDKQWWPTFWKYVTPLYDHPNHAEASVKKMVAAETISAKTQTVAEAVEVVKQHVTLGADA